MLEPWHLFTCFSEVYRTNSRGCRMNSEGCDFSETLSLLQILTHASTFFIYAKRESVGCFWRSIDILRLLKTRKRKITRNFANAILNWDSEIWKLPDIHRYLSRVKRQLIRGHLTNSGKGHSFDGLAVIMSCLRVLLLFKDRTWDLCIMNGSCLGKGLWR